MRTEKDRSLIVQNVVSRKIEVRVALKTVDAPESPDFSPDGKLVAFSGMQGSQADIFTVNLETKEIVNLTKDNFSNYAPTWAPDGKSLVYWCASVVTRRSSGWRPTERTAYSSPSAPTTRRATVSRR